MATSAPKLGRLVIKKAPPEAVETAPAKKAARKPAKKASMAQFSSGLKAVGRASQTVSHDTPVHRFVVELRKKNGVHYRTTQEVADELGVSTQWVRKIQRGTALDVPSLITHYGGIKVYLYTPDDLDKIRRYLVERQQVYVNPGPNSTIASWEDVKKRRDQPTAQDADRTDVGDRPDAH